MSKFTEKQLAVISHDYGNMVVSASAGSGKTSGGRHPRKSSTRSCSVTGSGVLSAAGPRNRARNFTFRR